MRTLEARLGIRLLTRTTRSVSPTEAGVRLGDQVAKDMIAVPIGPPLRMAVVGSPAYLKQRTMPLIPRDLADHHCINLRLPTHGSLLRVLEDWCQPSAGYHLYYPNRREQSSALGVVIDALRYNA
jgi:DNA-binding transcriptional LysR family regulator